MDTIITDGVIPKATSFESFDHLAVLGYAWRLVSLCGRLGCSARV